MQGKRQYCSMGELSVGGGMGQGTGRGPGRGYLGAGHGVLSRLEREGLGADHLERFQTPLFLRYTLYTHAVSY